MTWEIALGIFALAAFVVSIGKIVANNTKALTEVKMSLDSLKESLGEQKQDVKNIQSTLGNHEKRITILEAKE